MYRAPHPVRSLILGALLLLVSACMARAQTNTVPLQASDLISAEQQWGALQFNRSVEGGPLRIGGVTYQRGFGTHATSTIVCDLDRQFDKFSACAGVDDEMQSFGKSSVVFKVLGDGRELFDSGEMRNGEAARRVQVAVRGVEYLTLIVTDAGDGISGDHADWAEPLLQRSPEFAAPGALPPVAYRVGNRSAKARLSGDGDIIGFQLGSLPRQIDLSAGTRIAGFRSIGHAVMTRLPKGSIQFGRTLTNQEGQTLFLVDRFTPAKNAVHWDVELTNPSADFSAPVITDLQWPVSGTPAKLWMAWQEPPVSTDKSNEASDWRDPLLARRFPDAVWNYGEPSGGGFERGDIITLPIVSTLLDDADLGLSLVESPADTVIEMKVVTSAQGRIKMVRTNRRFARGATARWSMDLVAHQADWRCGLEWLARRYKEFFVPPNPKVQAMAGLAAYTGEEKPVDLERLRQMDFRTLWKLSDDYAYMGMFLPPLTNAEARWQRTSDSGDPPGYKPPWTSFQRLNGFAAYLRTNGCYLLDYFNTTEFGKDMKTVSPTESDRRNPDLWTNASAYLASRMPRAAVQPPADAWQGGWAVDPGDPDYQKFLLEQAERHLTMIPDSAGFCIDRADYLCHYNLDDDDGVTWRGGRPARALTESWLSLMTKLGPLLHDAGKVIFCNFMDPRLDLARDLDGLYDEYGDRPSVLNGAAVLCLEKPLLAWTSNDDPLSDAFFQRLLYLGAFPTAPYPLNNHCIQPSAERDRWYFDYGPLFALLHGKKWVLEAHCVEVENQAAKANLFQVDGGWLAPVVFGGTNSLVKLEIGRVRGLTANARFQIWHPGTTVAASGRLTKSRHGFVVPVGLERGCAMVKIFSQ